MKSMKKVIKAFCVIFLFLIVSVSPVFSSANSDEKYMEPHRPSAKTQKVVNGRSRRYPRRKYRLVYPEKNSSNSKLNLSSSELYTLYKKEKDPEKRKELYKRYKKAKAREKKAKLNKKKNKKQVRIINGFGKPIPTHGYLIDDPPNLPPQVKKKRYHGFKKIMRKLEKASEKGLGATVVASMELMYKVNKDPVLNARLNRVGNYIKRVYDRDIGIRFKILNMGVVNAFAVPGGTIYVTPEMLRFLNSDSELAFVLGHEVGHIVARHSMKSFEKGMAIGYLIRKTKWGKKAKTAAQIANAFLTLKYSRKHEFEADHYGYLYMTKAGFNPYAAVAFMAKMKNKFEKKKNSKVANWLSTHPSLHDRYSRSIQFYKDISSKNSFWKKVNGR